MRNFSHVVFFGAMGLVLLGGGCGQSLVERAVNNRLGDDGSVNIDNGDVTYTDAETGATGTYGSDVKVPSDFPDDLPLMDDITVSGVTVSTDGAWITFTTDDSIEDVTAWYESKLVAEGYAKQGTYSAAGTTTLAFEDDDASIGVLVAADASVQGKTMVTLTKSNK